MQWNESVKAFKVYLKFERGLSENSVVNYVFDIQKLIHFLDHNNIVVGPLKIDSTQIQQFIYQASYGPFALSMIVGFIAMILMILTTSKNKARIRLTINELTVVNELSLTVGLIMLTIGNFLGGQWANESWGRYWGWDPKETWALISILVYAFVLHMRLIPGMRSKWLFNLMSVLSFTSIIMTYFGVNFYLVGLHSYASGDKVITPDFVYYSMAIVFVVALVSYFRYYKFFDEKS